MHRVPAVFVAVALLLVGSSSPALAQRTTSTFAGIVEDTSGGILPGVDVVLTNEGTAIVDRQITSATGEFLFNYVQPGTYTLEISISGFKTQSVKGIVLGAAQNVRRRFALEVGNLSETITVSGEAPLTNTASTEQRISLEAEELATLPAANRNLSNLINIGAGLTRQEGVIEGAGSGNASGGTVRLRLNGLGGSAMSITANGTDASGNAGSRAISQYNGVSKIDVVSIESVGEINIVKGILPAEFGNALAGNMNIITKAGSNAVHGSLFHRYEGTSLAAKPFFLKGKPDSKWNQGGGSLGGPVLRDKAFFFVAYEKYRLERALELNANVPTQRFRDLLTTALPFPETQLFLSQYAAPTEPLSSPTALIGTFIGPGAKENTDDHLDARGDFRIKGGNLSVTFTYGHPFLSQDQGLPNSQNTWTTTTRRATASYALARDRWSYETRFGTNYNYLSRLNPGFNLLDPVNPGPIELDAPNRRVLPIFTFPGLTSFGSEAHIRGQLPGYTFEQQATLVTDRHAFKFGGLYGFPRGGRLAHQAASFTFLNEADILANRASDANFRPRVIDSRWHAINWGLFVQDDWRINTKLVVNMGVRYDYFGRFQIEGADPANPAGFINLDGEVNPNFTFGPPRSPDQIVEDDKGINLGPRLGFAYNPDGSGKTVISGGYALSYQSIDPQAFEGMQVGAISGVTSNLTLSAAELANFGIRYPFYNEDMYQVLLPTSTTPPIGALMDPNIQAPYAHSYSVSLQRAIGRATVVNAAYVGTRGYDFRMYRTYNLPDRITGLRPNPSLNQQSYLSADGGAKYNSLQTSLQQRLSRNLQFSANYTWSRTTANYDGDNGVPSLNDEAQNVQDFFDGPGLVGPDVNWGPALGDVTHNFIGDVIYTTPGRHWLAGGWQIAGIFRTRTGEPLTILQAGRIAARPDVIDEAGAINEACCDIETGNLQYLNPAAFELIPVGTISRQTIRAGNAATGQFRLPGYKNIDLSLGKSINLGGPRRLELRADILNLMNWVNYIQVSLNRSASNFGTVTGVSQARVAQVQARFSF